MIIRTLAVLFVIGSFATNSYSQIATTTGATICGEGSLVLHATATSGTIKWYTVPFYGTAIETGVTGGGTTFTTPTQIVTTAYYVDAVDNANCSLNPGRVRVPVLATISANSIQAGIFYASTTFCQSVNTPQLVTRTGSDGGVFSYAGSGGTLSINTSTGAITPSGSTVGTYTVTYTVTAAQGCIENPASTTVVIATTPLTSSIAYNSSPYCTSLTSAIVTLTNANSGVYSADPSGLIINESTGEINPSLSEPGSYTVSYVVSGAGGCAPQEPHAHVDITGLPTAVLSYPDALFCKSILSAQTPTLTGTGAYTGGSYRYTNSGGEPSGLTFSSGAITPSTSTAGTYTIYYSAPASGSCAAVEVSTSVTVNPLPTASIAGTTSVCQDVAEPTVTFTGTAGTAPFTFTYSVNGGGSQTVTTSEGSSVTVAQPTTSAGTYVYTLVSVADAFECTQTSSGTATITVIGTPVATFSYIGTPFCKVGTVLPTLAPGASKGTFTGTNVVFVSASTGEINLASTPAGTYTITNTITTCSPTVTATSDITINALPTASIGGSTACGSSVLTVTTNATAPSYVWYLDGTVIAGEISSTLTASTNQGSYTVKVRDGSNGCEFTSSPYVLTIIALPTASITGNFSTCETPTTLTAVTNAVSPTYIWYKNDEEIVEETASTLTVTGSGDYKVKVQGSNTCENTSAAVFVSIALIDNPGTVSGSQTVCTDASNSTALTLSGTKSTVRKWQYSVDPFSTWTDITNTTSAYTATGLTQTTKFRAAVQNGICDVAYSTAATVTVVPDPTISVQPAVTTYICAGGTAILSLTAANGTGNYSYQWQISSGEGWSNVSAGWPVGGSYSGETSSSLSVVTTFGTTGNGAYQYRCIVNASGNGCNSVTSNTATVDLKQTPQWLSISSPTPTTLCDGGTVAFSATVTSGQGGTISWIRSNNVTPGEGTEVTVSTGETPPAGTWYYRPHYAPIGDGCTLVDGTQTTVTVNPLPAIATSGTIASVTINAGAQTSTLAYTAATNSPTSYSINWDATANTAGLADQGSTVFSFIAGGGSLTGIVITAATPAGIYTGTMTITNANGCNSTQAVTLTVIPLAPTGSNQSFCSGTPPPD
jgi:hypothetical protein